VLSLTEQLRFNGDSDFKQKQNVGSNDSKRARRVLILQGPTGPFFSELHQALNSHGFMVQQVLFNFGDRVFAGAKGCIRFSGSESEWETWLRFEITQHRPDAILLFGSSRPAHKIARRLAKNFDVDVISFEEGYLRSGYVSAEQGGNNQHSPLAQWSFTSTSRTDVNMAPTAAALGSSFATMSFWAAIYYFARDLGSKASDTHLFHRRKERILPLVWSWGVHILCRLSTRVAEFPARRTLQRSPGYSRIPLQVSSDSQIQTAARGWSTPRLIDASLDALLMAGKEQRVVFKLHPLERNSTAIKRLILHKAKQSKVDQHRITIMHSGRMGDLTRHSNGMVLINSTSAFSALHHDIPLLVLGEAVFRHDEIVTLGKTEADIAAFFKLRHAKSRTTIDAFLTELKAQSLIPGDFYASRGRKVAIDGIVEKLKQLQFVSSSRKEVSG
jgi:capsular polysaccharide export protein